MPRGPGGQPGLMRNKYLGKTRAWYKARHTGRMFSRKVEITKGAFPHIETTSTEVGAARQQCMTIAHQGGQYVSPHTEAVMEKRFCHPAGTKL